MRASTGFKAEEVYKYALDILVERPDSPVAGYIWASAPDATAAAKRLDPAGLDFLVELKGLRFIYFPLQVKNKSTKKSSKGLKEGDILEEHYKVYPYFYAEGLDDRTPEEVAEYLNDMIKKFLAGEDVDIPGYPD